MTCKCSSEKSAKSRTQTNDSSSKKESSKSSDKKSMK